MTLEDFRILVIEFLSKADPTRVTAFSDLGTDVDLLGSAGIDSHDFIELCLAIEEKTGVVIDLGELEPEQFGTIAGLHTVVSASVA